MVGASPGVGLMQRLSCVFCDQANIKEVVVEIPHRMHNSIIGSKGRLIRAIMDECGGVIIRFPQEGTPSDKVTIRGPKDDVETARKQLLELVHEKVWNSIVTLLNHGVCTLA